MGNARLYFGSGVATPTTVQIVHVPDVPAGSVIYTKTSDGHMYRGSTTGLDLTGVNGIDPYLYINAYYYDQALTGPAIINLTNSTLLSHGDRSIFTNCFAYSGAQSTGLENLTGIVGQYVCEGMFRGCWNLTNTELKNLTSIASSYACESMFRECTSLTSANLNNLNLIYDTSCCDSMFANCINLITANLGNLTNIYGQYACMNMFANCTNLTNADLSNLQEVNGRNACGRMFAGCSNLTDINLSRLSSVTSSSSYGPFENMFAESGLTNVVLNMTSNFIYSQYWADNMFRDAHNLTNIDYSNQTNNLLDGDYIFAGCTSLPHTYFNNFTSITHDIPSCFSDCTNLTNAGMQNIQTINASIQKMFYSCTNLASVEFKRLQAISGNASFVNCFGYSGLRSLKFPALSTISVSNTTFTNMLAGVSDCTVYFQPNLESTIGNWPEVLNGFGGTNITVLFNSGIDLPVSLPIDYRVWINGVEVTGSNVATFIEGDNTIIFTYEDTISRFGTLTFYVDSETTEFILDPTSVEYSTLTIGYTGSSNITSLTAMGTLGIFKSTLNLSVTNPTTLLATPGFDLMINGESSDCYLPAPCITTSDEDQSITLVFEEADPLYISVPQLISTTSNTFAGTSGFEFLQEIIGGVPYMRLHSLGINNYGTGYICIDNATLAEYLNQGNTYLSFGFQAYASSENNYDFGYVLYGSNYITPPSRYQDVKNKSNYGGNTFSFNQSGENNYPSEYGGWISLGEYVNNGWDLYINPGFVEDNMYSKGTDSLYMSAITLTLS